MFSKIDKKILIYLILVLVVAAVLFIVAYKYLLGTAAQVQNSVGGAETESGTEVKANDGGLTICLDKCGDGVCQTSDTSCSNNNMNCICPEDSQKCAQDCK